MRKWSIGVALLVLAVIVVVWISITWRSEDEPSVDQVETTERRSDYITSTGCRECHSKQYESWHDSYHRSMTQNASVKSIVAPIDDVTLSSRGRTCRIYRKGDDFRVQMVDPDWDLEQHLRRRPDSAVDNPPVVDRQIVMTTGSHHHQVYWIKGRFGNELRQVPWVYHIATKEWVPNEDTFLQLDNHKRGFGLWNGSCIICHTVGGNPRFDRQRNVHESKFVELGIACEACHGPGGRHAEAHRQNKNSPDLSGSNDNDPLMINPARLDSRRSAAVCGQCHAHYYPRNPADWYKHGYTKSFRPGELYDETRVIVRYKAALKQSKELGTDKGVDPHVSAFWNDGSHRVGGREYNGLTLSGCYQNGTMTCLSCHSMHSYREPADQLTQKLEGNDSCLQCHKDYADRISEHTHHKADSTGSRCYNCHMPHTTYALFKAIRRHRVDSPKSSRMVKSDRPNACNLCHMDQTMQWTVDTLHKWYGQPRVSLDEDNQTIAASILWMFKGDAAQRAIAVWSAGWKPGRDASQGDWMIPYIAELLEDPYAAVRFMAARTLEKSNVKLDPGYKFWDKTTQWKLHRERVVDAWRNTPRKKQPDRNRRLLFDVKGLPIRREIDRLLRFRNNKRLFITE